MSVRVEYSWTARAAGEVCEPGEDESFVGLDPELEALKREELGGRYMQAARAAAKQAALDKKAFIKARYDRIASEVASERRAAREAANAERARIRAEEKAAMAANSPELSKNPRYEDPEKRKARLAEKRARHEEKVRAGGYGKYMRSLAASGDPEAIEWVARSREKSRNKDKELRDRARAGDPEGTAYVERCRELVRKSREIHRKV